MNEVIYTYDNWFEGEVRLSCSNSSNLIVEESIEVNIDAFTDTDQDSIRQTQNDIFENDANDIFLDWKKHAIKSIENSRMPKRYVEGQISQCIGLLEHPLPKTQSITLHIWKMKLDRGFVGEVQNYYSRVVLEGEEQDCIYISSINDPYRFEEQDPYSYSEAIVRYYSWLNSILTEKKKETISNWHPEVFLNEQYHSLFMEFINTVSMEELKWPDICFIFHEMYAKYYIIEQQTQKSFIKFINTKFSTSFDNTEIPKRTQKRNVLLYNELIKKYKE
jgi:hypothetical protein